MIKVAINGFGRIGRSALKRILDKHPDLSVRAINDLTDTKTLAYLLKYDSLYGFYKKNVQATEHALKIDGQEIEVLKERDPAKLPWQKMDIDLVLECTGLFTEYEEAKKHIAAGAKKVIVSAPCKCKEISHFVLGVNQDKFDKDKHDVVSMGSCTTNALAPLAKVLHESFVIEKGLMTTVHSYTNSQKLLDLPHKDLRRGRAAALSMVPTTTGAAIAVIKTIPELDGIIHGMAIRVPVPVVSLVDFVAKVEKKTTVEEVNYTFKKASAEERFKGILGIEDALLVSVDYKGNSFSAIVDAASTMVQKEDLIKVLAWYDNEFAYACRLAEFTEYIGKKL